MKRLIAIVIIVALVLIALSAASCFVGLGVYKDVSYLDRDACSMDIYLPRGVGADTPRGVILFIHGGSWSGGDKSDEVLRCRLLASRGYVTASINYTLWTEETKHEYNVLGVLDEIDAALLKVKSFLSERGIEAEKVALAGYSAGAHLAMLYSYSRHTTAPLEVVFVSSMAGPTDISESAWGRDMAKRVGVRLTGVEITDEMLDSGEADSLLKSVSPTSYVTPDSPPTLIMHGGRDDVVPVANADLLIAALRENSVTYDYVYMNRSNHMLWQNPLAHVTYFGLLLDYCRTYFGY